MMIIGNKSDVIDNISNEMVLDYISYILRKLATQNNSSLISVSSH